MKIPAIKQVIFINHVVAVAAYRSCRLWRWEKMSWNHKVLCDHYRTQCWHPISDAGHVVQIWILEDSWWMTSNRPQTECKVLPPDSCMLMMMRMLWLHGLWPYLQDLCLLTYKPLWQSRRSICWYGFSWCPLWLHSSGWRAADGPPGSFPYPVDTSWAVKAGQSILTVSNGLWCAIPGTVIHSGTWNGSWFLANRYDFRW